MAISGSRTRSQLEVARTQDRDKGRIKSPEGAEGYVWKSKIDILRNMFSDTFGSV